MFEIASGRSLSIGGIPIKIHQFLNLRVHPEPFMAKQRTNLPVFFFFLSTRRKVKQYFLNVKSFMLPMSIGVIFMKLRLIHSLND